MQQNRPFDTNPYINQTEQTTTDTATQTAPVDLGLTNTNPYINQTTPTATTTSSLLGDFDTTKFVLGAAIGAGVAYLLTNEKAQKALFKTVAKGSAMLGAGIEEMKERMEDAKAEMEAEQQ
jgi:hypothetical protein